MRTSHCAVHFEVERLRISEKRLQIFAYQTDYYEIGGKNPFRTCQMSRLRRQFATRPTRIRREL